MQIYQRQIVKGDLATATGAGKVRTALGSAGCGVAGRTGCHRDGRSLARCKGPLHVCGWARSDQGRGWMHHTFLPLGKRLPPLALQGAGGGSGGGSGSSSFSREELKALFSLQTGTRCDTHALLQAQGQLSPGDEWIDVPPQVSECERV